MRMSIPPLIFADAGAKSFLPFVGGMLEKLSAAETDILVVNRMANNIGFNGTYRLLCDGRNLCWTDSSLLQYFNFFNFSFCH